MKDMADLKLWKMSRVKKEANNACSVFYILLYSLMNNLHHNTVLSICKKCNQKYLRLSIAVVSTWGA